MWLLQAFWDSLKAVDAAQIQAYQAGICIGVLLLSALVLFPGGGEQQEAHHREDNLEETVRADDVANYQQKRDCSKGVNPTSSKKQNQQQQPRQKQQSVAAKQAGDDSNWTPHKKLNALVYAVIVVVVVSLLALTYMDHEDENSPGPTTLLGVILRAYFPKEAALLSPTAKRHE